VIDLGKRGILGVKVNAIDYDAAVERTIAAARKRAAFIVAALPVHGIMTGALDATHRYRLNEFDLVVPDGQPVRWALNLLYRTGLGNRVYGPNLMLRLCSRLAEEKLSIYLFGSRSETLELLENNLRKKFPSIRIAGRKEGRFATISTAERESICRDIRDSGASLAFVGLGCPRQEIWAYENRHQAGIPIVCVGAAFDFHAGTVRQAPEPLQRIGLEWAFRLFREPRRLWRRYLMLNPLYVAMVSAQASGLVDYERRPVIAPVADTNLA